MEYLRERRRRDGAAAVEQASIPKAVVPTARLYAQGQAGPDPPIRVNFQTVVGAGSRRIPCRMRAGRIADRGNGQTYGWNADNTAHMRDRNAGNSADQRYDTLSVHAEAV